MPMQTVYTKEFTPEQAGARVGWVSVNEAPGDWPVVGVNVVVATVGQNGAKHGYHELSDSNERLFSRKCDEGFVAISGLFVAVSKDRGIEEHGGAVSYQSEERDGVGGSILQLGASGYPDFVPDDERKQWASNPGELLGLLKQGLQEHRIQEHYPSIYYLFNGMMGHERHRSRSSARDIDPRQLFIVDNGMAETTLGQAKIAEEIVSAYGAIGVEDELMKRRLTVFSDIPVDGVPDAFEKSRHEVSAKERAILETKANMYAEGLVYIPIGFRPNGRSWPYMDALAETDHQAYGMELDSLRAKNIGRADHELDREISELNHRLIYAIQGSHVLRLLASAEQSS